MNENSNIPSLLGGSIYQVVKDEIFIDSEDPNQAILLLHLKKKDDTSDHPGIEPISLHFPDRSRASEFFHLLANRMSKDD